MEKPFRVAIVDDHTLFRQCIRAIFAAQRDFEVVCEAADGLEAARHLSKHRPDLVLIDLSMPRMGGAEAVSLIKEASPGTRVVVVTAYHDPERVYQALRAGADGYVVKEEDFAELLLAARSALQGHVYLSPPVCAPVVRGFLGARGEAAARSLYDELAPRERQVLKLLAEGRRNREIAELLCLSVKTVEKSGTAMRKKLGLRTIPELTRYALEQGLFER
ncbi:MAG: response regulator [Deferrisomatales bacterium]